MKQPETNSDDTGSAGLGIVTETIPLLAETLTLSKREVVKGKVRVTTHTQTRDEVASIELNSTLVDVTRVPVGRVVDAAPAVRTEGDTTIIPVLEERIVMVKQLYLKEELHLRRRVERDVSHIPVQLRQQTATIERLDAEGRVVGEPSKPEL